MRRAGTRTAAWALLCFAGPRGAVYTNPLMSFSAVTGPAFLALQQTKTFQDIFERQLWALVTAASIPIQVTGADRVELTGSSLPVCNGWRYSKSCVQVPSAERIGRVDDPVQSSPIHNLG